MRQTVFCLLSAALALSLPGAARAECRGPVAYPVLSLTEGLPMVDPSGAEIGRLGYLDALEAEQYQSTLAPAPGGAPPATVSVVAPDGTPALVPADQVLTFSGRGCLSERVRMSDIPRNERDLTNTLQAKALLGIRPESLETLAPGEEPQGIALRAGPSAEAPVLEYRKRYLLGYVYASHYDAETLQYWYFIGSKDEARLRLEEDGRINPRSADEMLGWVSQNDLVLWPQRQAVYPKGPEAFMSIVGDADLADADGRGVRIEWIDEAAPDQANSILKFSLLGQSDTEGVYSVAYPQIASDRAEPVTARARPTPAAPEAGVAGGSDATRVLLNLLADSTQDLDVLFVLDNTESMEVYRDSVIRGIEDLNNDPATDRETLRVAVAMFGDFFDSPEAATDWAATRGGFDPSWRQLMPPGQPFQFWLQDLAFPGAFPTLADLQARFGGAYADPQVDREEMGLAALDIAIRSTGWRQDSVRLVIYVGDDRARLFPGRDLADSAERIALTLKDFNALFLPINVAGRDIDDNNSAWLEQVARIAEAGEQIPGSGGSLPTVVAYNDPGVSDLDNARRGVRDSIASLFVLQKAAPGEFNLDEVCRIALENNVSCNIPLLMLQRLADADLSELEALELRTDLLRTGYYPIEDAEIFVALSVLERQGLESAMETVCAAMQDPGRMRRELEDMAEQLAAGFLGESRIGSTALSPEGETIPEFFARMTNLPAEYFSVFKIGDRELGVDAFVDVVIDLEDDPAQYRALQQELCLSARLLEAVGQGDYVDRDSFEAEFDEDFQAFDFIERAPLKEFEWRWGVGGGLQVHFVPQSFFPKQVL
ncbi:hypothetical protein [Pseudoponticoccus marisrubri]|uniref:VWFA domain-containing protein n=1 Tax=Pseudoponticoccus marisrubri TaxID=1685382 RepID=A0A0W7WPM9_9RHOB|nr:hypothetical protein [Pseudoponticoccus marisrubri]KUF12456.1 hypothetical protein AVJ23_01620 [Pseudoponticoccus marisrubri]